MRTAGIVQLSDGTPTGPGSALKEKLDKSWEAFGHDGLAFFRYP
jgi:hypothetical protein